VDNDNAIHLAWVCGCEDEPSDILHILLPTSLILQLSVDQEDAVPDHPQTEMTAVSGRHTDIGSPSISGDVCICGTFCCRLHRLLASRPASQPFQHMCRKPVAQLRVLWQQPSMLDRGELSVPRWHERLRAGVYSKLSQADCDGRSIQRSQFVDHDICTHLADALSLPIQMTNLEVHASGVPFQQGLPIPANPYFHTPFNFPDSSSSDWLSSQQPFLCPAEHAL